jgi:hypothetical protein
MSVIEVEAPSPVEPAPRRRAGWVTLAVVIVLMTGLGVLGLRWMHSPDAVSPGSGGVSATGPVGNTVVMGDGLWTAGPPYQFYELRTVDIESIVPRVVENDAAADIAVYRCTGSGPSALPVSLGCRGAELVGPGRMALGPQPPDLIVAVITTHRAGTVRIDGYDVTYRDGLQSGTQQGGGLITVTATQSRAAGS